MVLINIHVKQRKRKGLWRKHGGSPTIALINEMNPVISGWSNSFRIGVSKEVFQDVDAFRYQRAQRYMKRRHPRQSGWWRTEQYWGRPLGRQDRWVFQDTTEVVASFEISMTSYNVWR